MSIHRNLHKLCPIPLAPIQMALALLATLGACGTTPREVTGRSAATGPVTVSAVGGDGRIVIVQDIDDLPADYLILTDRPLDVAIEGQGMFRVILPDGRFGYTRNGQFQVDRDGVLTTIRGHAVDPRITLPGDILDLAITCEGEVTGRTVASPDSTTSFGTLQLHRFPDERGLRRYLPDIYVQTEDSGTPEAWLPGQGGLGFLQQGFISAAFHPARHTPVQPLGRTADPAAVATTDARAAVVIIQD